MTTRVLSEAEKKKYAAMTQQASRQISAISSGTIGKQVTPTTPKPAPDPTPVVQSKINKNPTINPKPIAPAQIQAPIKNTAPTPKKSGGGNNRSIGLPNMNMRQADGAMVPKGFDPIGAGVKKLDSATGIVSKITGSKAFNTAAYAGARGVVAAGEGMKDLAQGYKDSAGSPMRKSQDAIKGSYMSAASGVDSKKASETAGKIANKYITQPYLKSGMAKNLGNLGGATKGLVDLTTPVYSADALGRGTGGALEAADLSASLIPGVGLVAGIATKTLRNATDFVKLYDKSVDIVEVGKKSAKAAEALKAAPEATLKKDVPKSSMTAAQVGAAIEKGAKIFKDTKSGALVIKMPDNSVRKLDISDVKKHDDAAVTKMTSADKKFEAPSEEKVDVRDFKPGTFKGSSADLQAGAAKVYKVKGEKQINMSKEQTDMLVAERTAARKEAGIKSKTPESAEFNKKFDEKWYAQKGLQPNGGRVGTGEYQVTMADGSKHLVNAKDYPDIDLDALGKSKAGTAGKSADTRVKPPAGGPKLVNHLLDKAKAEGKTAVTLRNGLNKYVADVTATQKELVKSGKATQEQMDKAVAQAKKQMEDAMFQFQDATGKQGPPAPTGKLSKNVKSEASKAKSFYLNKDNDVTFTKVDGSKVQIKAKDMTPEDIVLLKQMKAGNDAAAKAPTKPESVEKQGTISAKGTYVPTEAEKLAAQEAAKEARAGKTFASKEEKSAFNKDFYDKYYAGLGAGKPITPKVASQVTTKMPKTATPERIATDKAVAEAIAKGPDYTPTFPDEAVTTPTPAEAYLKGEDISKPSKAATLAPTPPTSPEVKATVVPPAKGGRESKVIRRGNMPTEDWDSAVLRQAQTATKVENAKVGGTKKTGWRIINSDGTKDVFARGDLSPQANYELDIMSGNTKIKEVPIPATKASGAEALAKTDAAPASITELEPAKAAPVASSTVAPKAVDDILQQVVDAKKAATLKATPEIDGQISMDLSAAKMAEPQMATLAEEAPLDPVVDAGIPQAEGMSAATMEASPTPPQGAQAVGGGSKVSVGGNPAPSSTKAPMSWGKKAALTAGGVVGGGLVLSTILGGKNAPADGAIPTGPNGDSVLDYFNGTSGTGDIGGVAGGGGPSLGGGIQSAPQMQIPQITGQPAAQTSGQPGTPAQWYMIGQDGQLEGPYEGIIGPDNLTYYQDENGQWQRVPEGAVVDAPNGTDYQRGAGLDDADPTNDNIYNPENPYIPNLQEIIDPELDQIIEENGGYTVENLMEVYAPYIESQYDEIDAQVEADIIALREQLAARGMYNSDIALTQEQQIRAAGAAKKQGIYQQMLQQAQELAMEYQYKYSQLGEEQRMNDYEIESGDREFQQAVKEFEAETGIKWATLDLNTQKELFDQYDANRKYNLNSAKFSASQAEGGSGGADSSTLVKIQQEMLGIINEGIQPNPAEYVANKLKTYISLGQLSPAQAQQIAANLDTL